MSGNMQETREIYKILAAIDERERKIRRRLNRKIIYPHWFVKNVIAGMVLLCLTSLASAVYYRVSETDEFWAWVAIISLFLFYILALVLPFWAVFSNRKNFFHAHVNPLLVILENSRITQLADKLASQSFKRFTLQALKDVRFEIKTETEGFKTRIAHLIGALDKVGVFPGILALVIFVERLGEDQQDWAYGLAIATAVLYLLGCIGYLATARAERLVGLIDSAIKARESEPNA
jgi:hypothetical protein